MFIFRVPLESTLIKSAKMVLAATAACLAMMATGIAPASASETHASVVESAESSLALLDKSENPEATYAALSSSEKQAFMDMYAPASTEETIRISPKDSKARALSAEGIQPKSYAAVAKAGGCWATYVKRTVKNNFNAGLFDVYVEGSWCSNGTKVTSTSFARTWSTIGTIGWKDKGQIGKGNGIAGGEGRIWGQRKMALGSGGWDVIEHRTCVRINGGKTGLYSGGTTCSIY